MAVDDRLTVGLIGCGRIGVQDSSRLAGVVSPSLLPVSHAESIVSAHDLRLQALCDVDAVRLNAADAQYVVNRAYIDYRELIRRERPAIVSIATRTADRPAIMAYAIEHGVRGIYAEKPFSRSLHDCETTLALAAQHEVKLVYGVQRRFSALYRHAYEQVWSGEFGELVHVNIEQPTSLLMWSSPHSIDLLIYLTRGHGIDYVQAACEIPPDAIAPSQIDCDPLLNWMMVHFDNGVYGSITPGTHFWISLYCEKGLVTIDERTDRLSYAYAVDASRRDPTAVKYHPADVSGTQQAFRELAQAVRQNSDSPFPPQDILLNQQILFATVASSLGGGKRVSVADLDTDLMLTGRYREFYA